jgi:ankyrin repeat protein
MKHKILVVILMVSLPVFIFSQNEDINQLDANGNTKLIEATMRQDIYTLNSLISAGADVNVKSKFNDYTALHYAAACFGYTYDLYRYSERNERTIANGITMVKALLNAGADVNALGANGETALGFGAGVESYEITQLLLDANAYVNPVDTSLGYNPILIAALRGQEKNARLLLDKGGDFNFMSYEKMNTLLGSLRNNFSLDFIKALHQKGADLQIKNEGGGTTLFYAVRQMRENYDVLSYLIANGVDVNAQDNYGFTVLANTFSAGGVDTALVNLLISAKADVNLKSFEGRNSLAQLAYSSMADSVALCWAIKKFVKAGADVNALDKDGRTPLMILVNSNNYVLPPIQALIDAGTNLNIMDNEGFPALAASINEYPLSAKREVVLALLNKTDSVNIGNERPPIIWACHAGDEEIVALLIKKKVNVNLYLSNRYSDFSTPLIWASAAGHAEVVKLLIQAKANVNKAGRAHQVTPLMLASLNGHLEVVKLLLAAKANPSARNINGHTAAVYAISKGNEEIAKLLITVSKPSLAALGQLLIEASMEDRPGIVTMLIANKADVNAKRSDGYVPLILAVNSQLLENVKLLVAAGANLNYITPDGYTALSAAKENGIKEIIELLEQAGAK